MAPAPASALESSVCFALYSSLQTTLQLYRDLLGPWKLTFPQLIVLVVVWEREEVTPGELADALRLDASTVSGLLRRMERDGLVTRRPDDADRRAVRVSATPRSLALRAQLAHIEGCVADALDLDPDEARSLLASLHSLRTAVQRYDTPAHAAVAS